MSHADYWHDTEKEAAEAAWEREEDRRLWDVPEPEPEEHTHHFILSTPSGPRVTGRCKHCGLVREYKSWHDEEAFSHGKTGKRKGVGARPILGRAW